ncbi:MAG: aminotransferase class V-fold PLP-dependent enzyme [Candidatus Rokubacteria bacterium]|nr:aminotransferase class V-fold PLP-dependent enzyme [Candidatus Rokubacteria bacterium]
MPRGAAEALAQFAGAWATRGIRAWAEGWWDLPGATGDLLAPLIGAGPGTVVMQQNVTIALGILLSALDCRPPRDRLVLADVEFPTTLYLCQAHVRRGVRVEVVKSEDGLTYPTERVLDALDETTAALVVSHVLYKTGALVDVPSLAARARQTGALVVLDAYQSVGVLPVDVGHLGVDALVGGSVKWLCGGPGAGYLWVRPDLVERLEPVLTGWAAHAEPFAFDPPPTRYAPDPRRFLTGTPAIAPLYAARPGYEIVGTVGVNAIRAKSRRQTQRLLEAARARGWPVRCPGDPEARGGMVVVDPPHAAEVAHELEARQILVDHRPGAGIRIAPHFYSTDEECDTVIGTIEAILADGSWRRHVG